MVAPSQITSSLPGISRVSICKKRTTSGPMSRMVLGLHEDLPVWGNAPNGREMVTSQFDAQDGRLPNRCVGSHCHWQEVKTGLIHKDYRALFVFGLFFSLS